MLPSNGPLTFAIAHYFAFPSMMPDDAGVLSRGGMSGYGVMLGLRGFMLLVLCPCVSRHAGDLLAFFLLCFVAHLSSLRPIQSLTSGKGRPARPVYRGALILRVACRKS